MTSLDILYYALALGFIFFIGAIWYIAFHIVDTLQSVQPILRDVQKVTHDIERVETIVKDTVEIGIIGRIIKIAKYFRG